MASGKKAQTTALRRVPDACPNCPNSTIIEDYRAGDRICANCGFVVGPPVVDEGTEYRTFSDDKSNKVNPDRVGAAQSVLFSGEELGTRITGLGGGNTGPLGKDFSSENSLERSNQRNAMNGRDRSLTQAYNEIDFIASKLHIPGNITFEAKLTYKRVKDTGELNGHHYHFVAAACMYIATRQKGAGRSIKEIAAASSSVHQKLQRNIGRCYQKIRDLLQINDLQQSTEQTYLARFCDKLGFERAVTTVCNGVAKRVREMGVCEGKQAVSIAAATIYMVAQVIGRAVTAKDIATVAGHAEQTIRASYRHMYPVRHYLFTEKTDPAAVHHLHFWGEPESKGQLEQAQAWAAKNNVKPLVYVPEEFDVKPQIGGAAAGGAGPAVKVKKEQT
eukprot:m.17440 g.17440  ORF g.17440 m.17440 type:complete len:389 (-) comp5188_c0_seq1:1038-2204(-)